MPECRRLHGSQIPHQARNRQGGISSAGNNAFGDISYYLRLKMVVSCPRILRVMNFGKNLLAQNIIWELNFSMVYGFWPFEPSFLVKFKLLAKKSGKKLNLVSIWCQFLLLKYFCSCIFCEKTKEFVYFWILLHYFG